MTRRVFTNCASAGPPGRALPSPGALPLWTSTAGLMMCNDHHHRRSRDAGGFFLRQLTWPARSFDTSQSLRDRHATDLKALQVVVFTACSCPCWP